MASATTEPMDRLRRTAARLHSAAIHLLRRLRSVDDRSGLGPARLSALSVLVFGGPRSLGELAAAEQVTSATMSRVAAALEAEGLVDREPDPGDGRAIRLSATPAGRRLLSSARDRRIELLVELLASLDEREIETLERATAAIETALETGAETSGS